MIVERKTGKREKERLLDRRVIFVPLGGEKKRLDKRSQRHVYYIVYSLLYASNVYIYMYINVRVCTRAMPKGTQKGGPFKRVLGVLCA